MVLSQDNLYYKRMASSIGDKARLVPFISGHRILEIGFGGGELMDILDSEGYEVHGLDASEISVGKLNAKSYFDRVKEGFADEIGSHWSSGYFDTVILSSVLHEVFSYGNREEKDKHSLDAIRKTLAVIMKSLHPGGRIIIRDGVLAENWDEKTTMMMLNKDVEGVNKYLDMQPFKDRVSLSLIEEYTFLGNLESVASFAYTYTWGEDALPRESQELFGVMTQNEYCLMLEETGFSMVHHEEYVQQGYVTALSPKLMLKTPSGEEVSFPSTNAIWVAVKA